MLLSALKETLRTSSRVITLPLAHLRHDDQAMVMRVMVLPLILSHEKCLRLGFCLAVCACGYVRGLRIICKPFIYIQEGISYMDLCLYSSAPVCTHAPKIINLGTEVIGHALSEVVM